MRIAGALAALLLALAAPAARSLSDALEDLRSPDPEARARGRAALAADAEGSLLLRALAAPEGMVREAAASVVAADPARATGPVRAALRGILRDRGADGAARGAALRALGAAKDAGSSPEIRAALKDLPREAALALAAIGDPGALADLRAARDQRAGEAPAEVGFALAALGDPSGEELLVERLGGGDPVASTAALHLLRRLTGRDLGPSVTPWKEALRLRRLAEALGDRDWDRSEKALAGVLARGASAGNDLLGILADRGAPRQARGKAALALWLLRCEEAGPALLEAAGIGEDPWVRVYALEALGRIAWAPAAPALARMIVNDEDVEVPNTFYESQVPFHMVQSAAARALLDMGCEGALGVAVDQISKGGVGILPTACVSDFKVRVLNEALAILREFGGPGAEDGFGFVPEGGERERAEAAARAVAWWRSRPRDLTVKPRARFDDALFVARVNREIRILGQYKFLEMDRSRRTLILLGSPAIPHLAGALAVDPAEDPSGQVRIGAAQVLASIGRPEGIPSVRAALGRAGIAPVRCQLVVALAALGPPDGVPEAVRLLEAPAADERAAAAEALSLCTAPGAAEPLRRALARAGLDAPQRIHLCGALLAAREPAGMAPLLAYLGDPEVILRRRAWECADRWVEGLGPYDPDGGTGFEAVRTRWESQKSRPRFRERTVPGR